MIGDQLGKMQKLKLSIDEMGGEKEKKKDGMKFVWTIGF